MATTVLTINPMIVLAVYYTELMHLNAGGAVSGMLIPLVRLVCFWDILGRGGQGSKSGQFQGDSRKISEWITPQFLDL